VPLWLRDDRYSDPTLYATLTLESELVPIKILHCGNREFRVFFALMTLTPETSFVLVQSYIVQSCIFSARR